MESFLVFRVFLVVAAIAIGLMVWLATYRSRDVLAQSEVTAAGYAIRRYWFWVTLLTAVAVFAITIPAFPYQRAFDVRNALHVQVTAQQYGFTLPSTIPLNRPVVFDVTSRDVNHGFGIYTPGGRIFSQVQAMPGYVNHLELTFTKPGHYTIRCLEYCGIAHSAMQGGFDVK